VLSLILIDLPFKSGSVISNCVFHDLSVVSGELIKVDSYGGALTIENCQFKNIKESTDLQINKLKVIVVTSGDPSDLNHYVMLKSNTFSFNQVDIMVNLYFNRGVPFAKSSRNRFTNNKGHIHQIEVGTFNDADSSYFANVAGEALIRTFPYSTVSYTRSSFFNNSMTAVGLFLVNGPEAALTLTDLDMYDNVVEQKAVVLFAMNDSTILVSNCRITGNSARTQTGVFYFFSQKLKQVQITGTTIKGNTGSPLIYLIEASLSLEDSVILENYGLSDQEPANLVLSESTLSMKNCTLASQTSASDYCVMFASTNSNFTDQDSKFSNLTCRSTPFSISKSQMNLNRTSFRNIRASGVSLFEALRNSSLTLSSVNVASISNLDLKYGSLINLVDSNLSMKDSSIFRVSSTAVQGSNARLSFDGLRLQSMNSGVKCTNCAAFDMKNSVINAIQGTTSSVWLSNDEASPVFTIANSTFTNCTSSYGSALRVEGSNLMVTDSVFSNNFATTGGAVCLECANSQSCNFTFERNKFTNNSATQGGGGLSWADDEPLLINNTFDSNRAVYGPEVAGYEVQLLLIDAEGNASQTLYMYDVASGQLNTKVFEISLVDVYGQVVTTNNHSAITLASTTAEAILGGTTQFLSQKGVISLTDFIVTVPPGSSQVLELTCEDCVSHHGNLITTEAKNKLLVHITARLCLLGEILVDNACQPCSSGSYSLTANSTICTSCPSSAECLGGALVYPRAGHWRSSNLTTNILSCTKPSSCLGHANYTSLVGTCNNGYHNNLCAVCEKDWSKTSPETCSTCPKVSSNILRLAGIGVVVVIAVCILIYMTISSTGINMRSVFLKILLDYFQLVALTAAFNLKWPSFVVAMFSSLSVNSDATDQFVSYDCFMDIDQSPVYFKRLLLISLLPVIAAGFVAIGSFIVWYFCEGKFKNIFLTSLVIVMFLIHPNIIKAMFTCLNCMEIDQGELWLKDSLDIECWTGEHLWATLFIALPGLVVWGLGIPTVTLFIMIKIKKQLGKSDASKKFAFLYQGLRPKYFYWEFVILYRKIVVAILSVFLSSVSVPVQALLLLLVLVVSVYMQSRCNPYTLEVLNRLELLSIISATCTVYCGCFYLTGDLNENTKILLFAFIVGSNFAFIGLWLREFTLLLMNQLAVSRPRFVIRHFGWIRSLYNLASRTIFQELELSNSSSRLPEIKMSEFYSEVVRQQLRLYRS
jgi:hypothetical protein